MRTAIILCLCALAAVVVLFAGCGGSSGPGQLQIAITDAPLQAEEINVLISSVEVHKAGVGWTTVKTYDPPLAVDLMEFQAVNGFDDDPGTEQEFLLVDTPLAAGHYTMVRLHVTEVKVVVGGVEHDVDLRNLDPTGIKLNQEFDVGSGELVALLLDFNGKKSVTLTGEGTYLLQPVIAMVPRVISATIHGEVVFRDGTGAEVPVPPGATVEVYRDGESASIASAAINEETGEFAAGVLLPGTYDLKVDATGYSSSVVRLDNVVLDAGETEEVGQVIVSPP